MAVIRPTTTSSPLLGATWVDRTPTETRLEDTRGNIAMPYRRDTSNSATFKVAQFLPEFRPFGWQMLVTPLADVFKSSVRLGREMLWVGSHVDTTVDWPATSTPVRIGRSSSDGSVWVVYDGRADRDYILDVTKPVMYTLLYTGPDRRSNYS